MAGVEKEDLKVHGFLTPWCRPPLSDLEDQSSATKQCRFVANGSLGSRLGELG
jgi:hypothetical protein